MCRVLSGLFLRSVFFPTSVGRAWSSETRGFFFPGFPRHQALPPSSPFYPSPHDVSPLVILSSAFCLYCAFAWSMTWSAVCSMNQLAYARSLIQVVFLRSFLIVDPYLSPPPPSCDPIPQRDISTPFSSSTPSVSTFCLRSWLCVTLPSHYEGLIFFFCLFLGFSSRETWIISEPLTVCTPTFPLTIFG